jgi:Proprotein convertase P-domain
VNHATKHTGPVDLSTDNGGAGDDYGLGANDCSGTFTIFDDAAATPITAALPPFAGTFKPEQSLSSLNGERRRGTWSLSVADLSTTPGDTGTFGCWQLEITYKPKRKKR